MTATTRIVTEQASDTLRAPVAALRFKPDQQQAAPEGGATVWTVGAEGRAVPHHVDAGLSDGVLTAIATSDLGAGDDVIVGPAPRVEVPGSRHSLLGL